MEKVKDRKVFENLVNFNFLHMKGPTCQTKKEKKLNILKIQSYQLRGSYSIIALTCSFNHSLQFCNLCNKLDPNVTEKCLSEIYPLCISCTVNMSNFLLPASQILLTKLWFFNDYGTNGPKVPEPSQKNGIIPPKLNKKYWKWSFFWHPNPFQRSKMYSRPTGGVLANRTLIAEMVPANKFLFSGICTMEWVKQGHNWRSFSQP